MTDESRDPMFEAVDAYVAELEDASGIVDVLAAHFPAAAMDAREMKVTDLTERPCPDCGASGYATTYDGHALGTCSTCGGTGAVPGPHPDTERAERAEAELSEERARISEALTLYPAEIDRLGEKAKWLESDLAHCRSAGESYKARAEHAEAALARVRAIPKTENDYGLYVEGWNDCRYAVLAAIDGDADA